MHDVEAIMARLRDARALPELLTASFDAFEAIRVLARGREDMVPALFAAFMTVADAAVDGRQAIIIAPSLSRGPGVTLAPGRPTAGADIDMMTDALAALGALLDERLAQAAGHAPARKVLRRNGRGGSSCSSRRYSMIPIPPTGTGGSPASSPARAWWRGPSWSAS